MEEKLLLKMAIFTSIASLAMLFVIAKNVQTEESTILDAKQSNEGEKIVISGIVDGIYQKDGFSILKIKKQEEISVVAFENLSLKKGDVIMLEGKVEDYNGEKEVVADKIIKK